MCLQKHVWLITRFAFFVVAILQGVLHKGDKFLFRTKLFCHERQLCPLLSELFPPLSVTYDSTNYTGTCVSPTCRILSVTYELAIYTGTWMSRTYRVLSVTSDPTICTICIWMSPSHRLLSFNIYDPTLKSTIYTGVCVTPCPYSLCRHLRFTLFPVHSFRGWCEAAIPWKRYYYAYLVFFKDYYYQFFFFLAY